MENLIKSRYINADLIAASAILFYHQTENRKDITYDEFYQYAKHFIFYLRHKREDVGVDMFSKSSCITVDNKLGLIKIKSGTKIVDLMEYTAQMSESEKEAEKFARVKSENKRKNETEQQ